MAGLFGVLDVAGRGLTAASLGIRTAGHNIANVETPGYSRQRQIVAATRPFPDAAGNLGTGVEPITVDRASDAFLQQQLMRQGSLLGAADAQAQALSRVEGTLNEQGGAGLSAALGAFYDAFDDLAAASTPGAPIEREALRAAAGSTIDVLHSLDGQLRSQQRDANAAIEAGVGEINRLIGQIDGLNVEIVKLEVRAPANDLRDQLDLALRELSQLVDIDTFEDGFGRTTVTLSNGLPLVEGGRARQLETLPDAANPFDPGFVRIRYRDGANQLDATAEIGGGRLGGLLRVRDDLVPAAIRSLDTVTYNLVSQVNAVHAAGVGLDGTTGDFFQALAGVEDAARDVALDPAIVASTDAIAAGTTTAASDNSNALELAKLRDARSALYLPGDPPGPPSGPTRTLIEHTSAIVADVGQQARSLETSREQQVRILNGLESRRDEVSSVSLDEETTRLIQLQAAFQANARVVSILDRLLDDVLEMI